MNTWYYTLIFIFSIITTIGLLYRFTVNLLSIEPNKVELNYKEKLVYGMCISYLVTYLIYI
jgi:hypothetical protein